VRDVSGGEGELSRFPGEDFVPQLEGELAFEDVDGFVGVVVAQRPSRKTGGDGVIHDGDLLSALFATQKDVDRGAPG
jgi:hypothetical protein